MFCDRHNHGDEVVLLMLTWNVLRLSRLLLNITVSQRMLNIQTDVIFGKLLTTATAIYIEGLANF